MSIHTTCIVKGLDGDVWIVAPCISLISDWHDRLGAVLSVIVFS